MTLKITQLMISKGFGGAERLFIDMSLALAETGVKVQAICHKDFVKKSALHHPNIDICAVNVRGVWGVWSARKITHAIHEFQPAVIHSHLARGAWFAGRAARTLGIPLAVNLHNYVKLKYYRDAAMFVPGTEDQKQYLMQHGIAAQRIQVIPHFSLLNPADQLPSGDNACPVFVSYGRMVKKKGFDVLLQAFKMVLDQGLQARLIIGGDGAERSALLALVEHLDLASRVEFHGWVEDVAAFLDSGDIFVLPSLDEPFGIVVLEAMARGKTIISTRTQGPVEVLNEHMAYFAEVGDAASLARTMALALGDEQLRLDKAAAALASYRSHYSRQAVIPQFIDLYQRMISRAAGD